MWRLMIRTKGDAEGFVLGEEADLREAMEAWAADPDGNIAGRKVLMVTGMGNEAHRPQLTFAIVADEVKAMQLSREA